jgi:hypothetical protein
VLWGFLGRPLPEAERDVLARLRRDLSGELGENLAELVTPAEVDATVARIDRLLTAGVFPEPVPDWPAVPWPPM